MCKALEWYLVVGDNVGMKRPFLQAHWARVSVVSYAVPPEKVIPYLPRGLEPDQRDGKTYVSLVGFDFEDTRVHGVLWPFHRDFPEVNLRCYARVKAGERHAGERGVCFIREFVPKALVSWVARRLYNEPYETVKVTSDVYRNGQGVEVVYRFRHHERWQEVRVAATRDAPLLPDEQSLESFFLDHQWGFGRDRAGLPTRYRVVHPRWLCYHVQWAEVKVNWGKTYGPQWKFLEHEKPCSSILAEGSRVVVSSADRV
jgi:uncharacterized protein